MRIRKATQKDIKDCIRLARQEGEKYWKETDFKNSLKDKNVVFLVAEDFKVIGYCLGFIVPTKNDEALIHETRVEVKERGKGTGAKLVEETVKELGKRKVKTIYAMVEPELEKFYIKRCGFKKTGKWIEASINPAQS